MQNIANKPIFIICFLLASLGQVTADLYLPSLPAIAHHLSVSLSATQMTVAFYMYGLAIAQLLYGLCSDAYGRKKCILIGTAIMLIGSIICVSAYSISSLYVGRLLQGLGAGCGIALARAILRDVYEGKKLATMMSFLSIGTIGMIALAPFIGGYIQHYLGWRYSFGLLSIYALFLLVFLSTNLPETNLHRHANNLKPHIIINNIKTLFHSRLFVCYCAVIFLTYAGVMAWVTAGPVLLQKNFLLTPVEYGWVSFVVCLAYAAGAFVNSRLLKIFSARLLTGMGLTIMTLSGILMWLLLGNSSSFVISGPVFIFLLGSSFVFANAYATALNPFPKIAGITSSLFTFVQIVGGATASSMMAHALKGNQIPLAAAFIGTSAAAIGFLLLSRSRH